MKKTRMTCFWIFMLLYCCSCAFMPVNDNAFISNQSIEIATIDGNNMVKAEDVAYVLDIKTYIDEDNMICFEQDGKIVKLDFDSQYVFQYQYRVDYLKSNSIKKENEIFIPLLFITDYLKIEGEIKDNKYIPLNIDDFDMYNVVKFLPEEIWAAYNDPDYPDREKILAQVDKPRSMDIDVPNIDISRLIWTCPINDKQRDILLYNYKYERPEEIKNLTQEDYTTIEHSQFIEQDIIENLKLNDPALANNDLKSWTYGELNEYYEQNNNGTSKYSPAEKQQFAQRGIIEDDISILYKHYHDIDTILDQPDESIREILLTNYQDWYNLIRDCRTVL